MDPDNSQIDKLINLLKSSDVDAKVDALSKIQAEFESGTQLDDPDNLINALKTCLRTSNQHLTNAALTVLPSLLPLLITRPVNTAQSLEDSQSPSTSTLASSISSSVIDVVILRHILMSLLPAGGIVERLGDKERAQAKARETLVILGGFAFRSGASNSLSTRSRDGKSLETPLMVFERFLKDGGLGSKVWKVREQSILVLVHIRRSHHLFPLRPYLPLLVDCLEDTDAHVRDCARQSVVELFSGPAVTDAARADLKKEMTKKGVRKTIVDGVLSKLLNMSVSSYSHSKEDSENGDSQTSKLKEYIPPSIALQSQRPRVVSQTAGIPKSTSQGSMKDVSRPQSRAAASSPVPTVRSENADIQAIYVASARDLESEFSSMAKAFEGKETEHNWALREQAVLRVRGMLKGEVHTRYTEAFFAALKDSFAQWSLKTLASLRTTVATNTCLLYSEMASLLGPSMDPFCDLLLSNLLKMSTLTKKITAQQSQASAAAIITHTSSQPRTVIPLLWSALQEKTVQARAFAVSHIKLYLKVHGFRSKHAIESSGGLDIMEKAIKKALADPNPAVRESARTLFWTFEEVWKERGFTILESLEPTARRQLEKACPNPQLQAQLPPSTPSNTKKSSVAAAIAASRAKAKVIATAPPSLRHQATSVTHGGSMRRAGPSSTSPRNSLSRPGSPLRTSSSPASPQSRAVPAIGRSASSSAIPCSHNRTRLRTSSPLAVKTNSPSHRSTIRKAIQTALPASPTSLTGRVSPMTHNVSAPRWTSQRPVDPEESLLLAQCIPLPDDDSDSDGGEMFPPAPSTAKSQELSFSPKSANSKLDTRVSNALSSGSFSDVVPGQIIVEDALRARAEQAESAAERLLELVEPKRRRYGTQKLPSPGTLPITPVSRSASVIQKAAMFQDSPAYRGSKNPSLLNALQPSKHETGWLLKHKRVLLDQNLSSAIPNSNVVNDPSHLLTCISELEGGDAKVSALRELVRLCQQYKVCANPKPPADGTSPFLSASLCPEENAGVWANESTFDRLFNSLVRYLVPDQSEECLESGLMILWEILSNQTPFIEGKESELFSAVLRVRYSNCTGVLEASSIIRDWMTSNIEPVYGLTTMHASLRAFWAEPAIGDDEESKRMTYAFGLIALGKFVLRLPAEIAEEEVPRLRATLISALNDKSSLIIRESAAAVIIAVQLILRDETHLFTLLDGLADDKKNLLTYLFDKHGVRGNATTSGMDKLEKEIRRLDTRTTTPSRRIT
ncbi:clasp N terminal-domain-containing protein [Cyathus striatus]|nr:clasp N terminal-domain-containing protein [Cyathus striatus]